MANNSNDVIVIFSLYCKVRCFDAVGWFCLKTPCNAELFGIVVSIEWAMVQAKVHCQSVTVNSESCEGTRVRRGTTEEDHSQIY